MRIHHLFSSALLCILFAGCTLVPGQHLVKGSLPGVEMIPIDGRAIGADDVAPDRLPTELLGYRAGEYRIGAGDYLRIVVWLSLIHI